MDNHSGSKIFETVDKYRDLIFKTEGDIWKTPETGYREWKTHEYMAKAFEALGYKITLAGNIPGFYTDVETGRPGPKIVVFGELDALLCPAHPDADSETGAVHACAHNAQCAALIGIAAALRDPALVTGLSGSIRLCAVPAEEGIEITYRNGLIEKGIIEFVSGKQEFMRRGLLDGVDIGMMVHQSNHNGFSTSPGANGCLRKQVVFHGVSAHAGGSPHEGVNALYAATLALNGINALRETFEDSQHVRVHPILRSGGNAVNAIPDEAVLESYVRGYSVGIIEKTNVKVNRAIAGAALAMGASVTITDKNGSAPLKNNAELLRVAEEAAAAVLGNDRVSVGSDVKASSTDMGDISAVMPAIHPHVGGLTNALHSSGLKVTNPELACVDSAKIQLLTLRMLLGDGAEKAIEIVENGRGKYPSFKEHLAKNKELNAVINAVEYTSGGIKVNVK